MRSPRRRRKRLLDVEDAARTRSVDTRLRGSALGCAQEAGTVLCSRVVYSIVDRPAAISRSPRARAITDHGRAVSRVTEATRTGGRAIETMNHPHAPLRARAGARTQMVLEFVYRYRAGGSPGSGFGNNCIVRRSKAKAAGACGRALDVLAPYSHLRVPGGGSSHRNRHPNRRS